MKTPRTLPLKTISLVAVAALMAAFVTTAKAAPLGLGSSFSRPKTVPLDKDLTPAEKSRLSQEQLKALARRSLHRMTADELSKLKKCQEYSHFKPESCDPMILEAQLAEARSIIAKGLPESKRAGYEKLIKSGSSPKVDAFLAGIPLPGPTTGAPGNSKPQPSTGKPPRKPRTGTPPEAIPQARPPKDETTPAGGTEAALDLKELDKSEFESLTPEEQAKYKSELERLKGDPAGLARLNAEYRKKAAEAARLAAAEKDFNVFKGLSHDDRKRLCQQLIASSIISGTANGGCDDILANVAKATFDCMHLANRGERPACLAGIKECQSGKPRGAAPTTGARTVDKNVAASCKMPDFGDALIAGSQNVQRANLTVKNPTDCEKKDKDGKCVEEKKADPNEWLAVKTGAVGTIPGIMVGSFFGPVGIVIGAAVGFGLFWGLSKLTN